MTGEPAEIRADRVAAVLAQTPLAVAVTVVNAGLMTSLAAPAAMRHAYLAWLVISVAAGALRLLLWHRHRRDSTAALRVERWERRSTLGAAAAGLCWGGGAALLWPADDAGQLFWVFVVGGMCAGAAALQAAHLPTAMAFILPAGLPVVARFALSGSEHGLVAAAMSVVFIAALIVTSRRSARVFGAYVAARLDLARQAAALDAANASLREAMAHHRAAEASLRHAQKMEAVGQLTGGIAHDFNNLLTAVLGSLALLRKRLPPEDARAARLLENAYQGAERGAALTQRLLAFGRRQALTPLAVDLPALVAGMTDLLRSSLGSAISIEARFPPDLPPVQADANQLELAVLNLALNARDAMPGGGVIRIGAVPRRIGPNEEPGLDGGDYVVLTLADSGEGMDEPTLARAMEPFFTTKGVGKGTGLGLSMVHGMVAQLGGRLALRSRKGAGTEAMLWLPRATPGMAAASALAAAPPAPVVRGASLLLVDDDPLVLGSTAALLEDLGHRVLL
ncbi:MAG: hypothetical protein K2X74_00035, partial [Acetobacteraceae bacterium]|nr:hypothetical protein [Acetobacteraceae bacterium]